MEYLCLSQHVDKRQDLVCQKYRFQENLFSINYIAGFITMIYARDSQTFFIIDPPMVLLDASSTLYGFLDPQAHKTILDEMDYSDGISKFIFDPGVHRPQRVDMEHFWYP
ncbi:hypothetical protein T06_2671 [Trichinella sp. T6]|nr:hypothetical protein T06_2671 [Trichinella sp. T6]